MLITYTSNYTSEVLVCTSESEQHLLSAWFAEGTGRELEDYDRCEHPSGLIKIRSDTHVWSGGHCKVS